VGVAVQRQVGANSINRLREQVTAEERINPHWLTLQRVRHRRIVEERDATIAF
jgi:hypothetical protein